MNWKEWQTAIKDDYMSVDHTLEWKCKKLQQSLKYNSNPKATIKHHLRDTEEQRKYNDEHYELWGFEIDEDGNEHFEYGKYIIFMTQEEHNRLHAESEETRKKKSESLKGEKNPMYGKPGTRLGAKHTDASKLKDSAAHIGERNGMYGMHHTDESKDKISKASKDRWADESYRQHMSDVMKDREFSEEHCRKLSESKCGEKNPMHGKHHTEEEKEHLRQTSKAYWTEEKRQEQSEQRKGHAVSDETRVKIGDALRGKKHTDNQKAHILSVSARYKEYKANGGTMTWNEFQKAARLYD